MMPGSVGRSPSHQNSKHATKASILAHPSHGSLLSVLSFLQYIYKYVFPGGIRQVIPRSIDRSQSHQNTKVPINLLIPAQAWHRFLSFYFPLDLYISKLNSTEGIRQAMSSCVSTSCLSKNTKAPQNQYILE